MELEFSLQESDLRALVEHQIRKSPLVSRRIVRLRMGYTLGFALCALGTYLTFQDRIVSYVSAVLALLSLIFYAPIARRRIQASIPRLVRVRMRESSLGLRRLRALPDGLEQTSPTSQSKVKWSIVGPVESREMHAFIPIDGVYTIVIPMPAVPPRDLAAFIQEVGVYKKAAA